MYIERLPFELRQLDNIVFFDDFNRGLDSTNCWTKTVSASATITASGGIVTAANAGTTANDEAYLATTQVLFGVTAKQPCYLTAYIQWTEENTNQANVFFGLMSGVATGALVSGNGGVRSTGTAIGLHKLGGGTNWIAHAQNPSGTTTTLDDLSTTQASNTSTYTKLEIEIQPQLGYTAEISYRVDNVLLRYNNNQQVIKHQLDLTSATPTQLCLLLRAGTTATNAEVLNCDYIAANMTRSLTA